MQQFLPSFPLSGRKIIVIGDGEQAEAKLRLFLTAPCELVWFTLDRAAPAPANIAVKAIVAPGAPSETDIADAAFIFIGVEDGHLAEQLLQLARSSRALVNVVDRPDWSDFHTPALVDRDSVTIAIATGGAAPILARDIRSAVEQVVAPGIGRLASIAASLRDTVKNILPNIVDRRRYWERALRGKAALLADKADVAGTKRALLEELNQTHTLQDHNQRGDVHLVGAGPGDPELLTLKAARLLRDADVIVYDRLVSPEILSRARRDAKFIDVGKTKGHHPVSQDQINQILIDEAQKGQRVIRLKGGDPFIFGRGGEEMEAVRAAGLDVHIVPGISAALGCAASAGIPLTHREHAQAVTFASGQPKQQGQDVEYASLAARNLTSVFYMGIGQAEKISRNLIAHGLNANTPIAIVQDGTLPQERVIKTTLGTLANTVIEQQIHSPAVIIVGEVSALAVERGARSARSAIEQKRQAA